MSVLHSAGDNKTLLTVAELRDHLTQILQIVAIFGIAIFSCVGVSIAFDIHAMRMNEIQGSADFRVGVFSRVDSLLWKLDTFLSVVSAGNKSLASALTQVRIQVKESSDDQTKSIKASSTATTAVVKQTLESNSQALEKVADATQPVINVEAPKSTPVVPPIVVNAPPPTVAGHSSVANQSQDKNTRRHSHFHWLRKLWPF